MSGPLRPTLRLRIAGLLVALILVTGLILLVASYLLVRANITSFHATTGSGAISATNVPAGGGPSTGRPESAAAPGATLQGPESSAATPGVQEQIKQHTLARMWSQDAVILALLAVLAAAASWLIAGRMLRPLGAMTRRARSITGERLDQRLEVTGPRDELRELAETLDSMLERLEAAFHDQQLFSANAAHELRTPLAVMRAELDLALAEPVPSPEQLREAALRLRRSVDRCEHLTERLLTLTRSAIAPSEMAPVRLDELVREQLEAVEGAIHDDGLTSQVHLGEAVALGDRSLLEQMVRNLLDNAIAHNNPDGWLAVSTSSSDGRALLEVSNSGPELTDTRLTELLEPFRRAHRQRVGHGAGLGLSIVHTVVQAHAGTITLNAIPDGGLAVHVILPGAT